MLRITILALIILIIFVGIVACFSNRNQSTEIQLSRDTRTCTIQTGTPLKNFFGVAAFNLHSTTTQSLLKESGATVVRVEFRWDAIEPTPGEFNWENSDAIISHLTENNYTIIATINHPPTWSHNVVRFSQDFENFTRQFSSRYKTQIDYYEIFNEPNLPGYGWPFGKKSSVDYNTTLYANILTAANVAIRQVDSKAFIIFGGLSPENNPEEFYKKVNIASTDTCFDIVSFHPYGKVDTLIQVKNEWAELIATTTRNKKPIWFGEFGTSDETIANAVLTKSLSASHNLDGMIWFSLQDLKPHGWNFGLAEFDGTKKATFDIFANWQRSNPMTPEMTTSD